MSIFDKLDHLIIMTEFGDYHWHNAGGCWVTFDGDPIADIADSVTRVTYLNGDSYQCCIELNDNFLVYDKMDEMPKQLPTINDTSGWTATKIHTSFEHKAAVHADTNHFVSLIVLYAKKEA